MSMDISSVVSKSITVLSKRINKPGKGKRSGGGGGGAKRAPGEVLGVRGVASHTYIRYEGEALLACWSS